MGATIDIAAGYNMVPTSKDRKTEDMAAIPEAKAKPLFPYSSRQAASKAFLWVISSGIYVALIQTMNIGLVKG